LQRVNQINMQIDELEFRQDLAEEEKKRQKEELHKQKIAMFTKAGGGILGGLIGGLAGGIPGAMEGAKIGAGVGGIIAGTTGKEFNAADVYEGMTDTISGFMGVNALQVEKEIGTGFNKITKALPSMNATDSNLLLQQINILKNNPSGLRDLLKGFELTPSGSSAYSYLNEIG